VLRSCKHGNEPLGASKARGISQHAKVLLYFDVDFCSLELVNSRHVSCHTEMT